MTMQSKGLNLFDARAGIAFVIACLTLVVSSAGFYGAVHQLNIYLQKEPIELRKPLSSIPPTLGRWQKIGQDKILSEEVVENLQTDIYLSRDYAFDGNPSKERLQLHIAYYTPLINKARHVPERCWGAAGLNMTKHSEVHDLPVDRFESTTPPGETDRSYPTLEVLDRVTGKREIVHLPAGDIQFRITEFQFPKALNHRMIGGYMFISNGEMTPTALLLRTLAFDRTTKYAYYCKIQLSWTTRAGDDRINRYRELAGDFMQHALPQLARCLPDWPEAVAEENNSS